MAVRFIKLMTIEGHSYLEREKTISMMKEIDTYEADYYLCSHESICTREEIESYWTDLKMGVDVTRGCSTIEEAIKTLKIYIIEIHLRMIYSFWKVFVN